MKHKILGVTICLALLTIFILPTTTPSAQSLDPVRLGLISPINQLDPLFVENSSEAFIVEQLFSGLVRLDENENLIPDLAESWEASDDGLTWTFFLRPGIPWVNSNLDPIRDVTVEDVQFSMNRAIKYTDIGEILQGVDVIDDFTVLFSLRAPDPDFGTVLAVSPAAKIVPLDLVDEAGEAWTEPGVIWGSGAYLIAEQTPTAIGLEANPYRKDDRMQVHSARIEYIENHNNALQQYLRGEYDLIELDPEILDIVIQEPGLQEQVQLTGSAALEIFSRMPPSRRLSFGHGYLVKPYLFPVFSDYFGLGRLVHWRFDLQPQDVQIPGTTRVLNDETLGALSWMEEDQSRLEFERITPQLSLIFVDDIIVGDSTLKLGSNAAPYGFLRRVVDAYSQNSGRFVIETVPASLEEAIQNGGQSASIPIDFGSIYHENLLKESALPNMAGIVPIKYAPPYLGLKVNIDHVVFDEDGDTSTTDDQVKARGWVNVEPGAEVHLDFDIRDHHLQYLNFLTISKESARVELYSKVDLINLEEDFEIYRYTFFPVTFFVGYVPVVITPELTVSVGAEGKVSVELTTGVEQSATIEIGANYHNGDLQTIVEIRDNQISKLDTDLKLSAGVEAFAGPKLSTKIYGVAGPYGRIKGYLDLSADPSATPWWTLKSGVDGEVGIRVEVFNFVIATLKQPITILPERVIAQADTPTTTPTYTPPPTEPTPEPTKDPQKTCSAIWWPPRCWPWWLWVLVVVVALIILGNIFG